jgi:hypothetical protein
MGSNAVGAASEIAKVSNEKIETPMTTGGGVITPQPKFVVNQNLVGAAGTLANAATPFIYGLYLAGVLMFEKTYDIHRIALDKAGQPLKAVKWLVNEWTITDILSKIDGAVFPSGKSDKDDVFTLVSERDNISKGFQYFLSNLDLFKEVNFDDDHGAVISALLNADTTAPSAQRKILSKALATLPPLGNQSIVKGDATNFEGSNAGEKFRKNYAASRAKGKNLKEAIAALDDGEDPNAAQRKSVGLWLRKASDFRVTDFDNAYDEYVALPKTTDQMVKDLGNAFIRFAVRSLRIAAANSLKKQTLDMLKSAITEYENR